MLSREFPTGRPTRLGLHEGVSDAKDMADRAVADSEVHQNAENIKKGQERYDSLKSLEARISKGDPIYCKECDEEIDLKRFEAYPFNQFCVDCQEVNEARDGVPRKTGGYAFLPARA